jgi:hypothetical protein
MNVLVVVNSWPAQNGQFTQFGSACAEVTITGGVPSTIQCDNPGLFISTPFDQNAPCPSSMVAVLSNSIQASGYHFVDANGGNLPSPQTFAITQCQANLFVQAPGVLPTQSKHGGGEVAFLIFLASALVWGALRRLRHTWP